MPSAPEARGDEERHTHTPTRQTHWNADALADEEAWFDEAWFECGECGEFLRDACLHCDDEPVGPFFCARHQREHDESMARSLERWRKERARD
jgi:hypothetical protein